MFFVSHPRCEDSHKNPKLIYFTLRIAVCVLHFIYNWENSAIFAARKKQAEE